MFYDKEAKRKKEDRIARDFLDGVKETLTERAITYPPYSEEAEKVAAIWTALNPTRPLHPGDIPSLMMITKLVRLGSGNTQDSLTDLCGYAARFQGMSQ